MASFVVFSKENNEKLISKISLRCLIFTYKVSDSPETPSKSSARPRQAKWPKNGRVLKRLPSETP